MLILNRVLITMIKAPLGIVWTLSRSRDPILDMEPHPSPRVDARGIGLSV